MRLLRSISSLVLIFSGFAAVAGTEKGKAPFTSSESFQYESRKDNPAADLLEAKDFLGNVVRAGYENEETEILKLFNISVRTQKIDEGFCRKVGTKMFQTDGKDRRVSRIEKLSTLDGAACDVVIADSEEGFHERHLIIFNLHGHAYGLRAIFPKGANPAAEKELVKFVQTLR